MLITRKDNPTEYNRTIGFMVFNTEELIDKIKARCSNINPTGDVVNNLIHYRLENGLNVYTNEAFEDNDSIYSKCTFIGTGELVYEDGKVKTREGEHLMLIKTQRKVKHNDGGETWENQDYKMAIDSVENGNRLFGVVITKKEDQPYVCNCERVDITAKDIIDLVDTEIWNNSHAKEKLKQFRSLLEFETDRNASSIQKKADGEQK